MIRRIPSNFYINLMVCLLLTFSCKEKSSPIIPTIEAKVSDQNIFSDTSAIPIKLKEFTLLHDDLIKKGAILKYHKLNQVEVENWKIKEIDAFYDDQYSYHLLDTILTTKKYYLALIARADLNENIIWLCTYETTGKMLHAEEVFYENAEGNYQLESFIKNNILTLNSDDINEGKKSESFRFDETFKIEKTESQ